MNDLMVIAADNATSASPNVGTIVFLGATAGAILTVAIPITVAWRARRRSDRDETPDS